MLFRACFLLLLLVSVPAKAAFHGDWAAADLYAFLGVTRHAGNAEILTAFGEGAAELGASSRAGLNVQARLRALTNARNILIEEHSRSVYNAYLDACEVAKVSPGTADQQQQLMAEYLKDNANVGIAEHKERFPKFYARKPARYYAPTDFTLHPVTESNAVEVATPLVEPEPAQEANPVGCGMSLSNFRRLVLILTLGTAVLVATPVRESENSAYPPPNSGNNMHETELAPRPVELPPAAPPPETAGPPRAAEKVAPAKSPASPNIAQPPAQDAVPKGGKDGSAEGNAGDRGQNFRNKLGGTPVP